MQTLNNKINNIASDHAISGQRFGLLLALDALVYICLFYRDYDISYQFLIAHYISFVAISDLGGLFLAPKLRQWFNVFRLFSSVSLLILVLALFAKGLDGDAVMLTMIRVALLLIRALDSALLINKYGPWLVHIKQLPSYVSHYFNQANSSNKMAFGYIIIGIALLLFPQLAYWTHYNMGENRLDDILTAFQGQAGIHFAIKLFFFEILVLDAFKKVITRSAIAILFIAQWPFMLSMFYLAPIPVVHIVVEGFEVVLVFLAFKHYKTHNNKKDHKK